MKKINLNVLAAVGLASVLSAPASAQLPLPGLDALPGLGSLPLLGGLPGLGAIPGLGALPIPAGLPGLDGLPGLGGGAGGDMLSGSIPLVSALLNGAALEAGPGLLNSYAGGALLEGGFPGSLLGPEGQAAGLVVVQAILGGLTAGIPLP